MARRRTMANLTTHSAIRKVVYRRQNGRVRDDDAGTEAVPMKKTRAERDPLENLNVVRLERSVEWKTVYIHSATSDAKEAYLLDPNRGREGSGIKCIHQVRDIMRKLVKKFDIRGLDNDPLLAYLCDYGGRVVVEGVGYESDINQRDDAGNARNSKVGAPSSAPTHGESAFGSYIDGRVGMCCTGNDSIHGNTHMQYSGCSILLFARL